MTPDTDPEPWRCADCGASNPDDITSCLDCGTGTRPARGGSLPSPSAVALRHRLAMLAITLVAVALVVWWIDAPDETLPYVEHSVSSCTVASGATGTVWNRSEETLDVVLDVGFVDRDNQLVGAFPAHIIALEPGEMTTWSVGAPNAPEGPVTCLVIPEVTVVD